MEQSTAAPAPVIEARNLDLVFETADTPVHALKGIDLTVNSGEFVSFIGPSGCGKTTLLRVIADLEQPTGGSISVNGMTPDQARQARAYGYVFQAAALYPWRTIEKNVALPLEIMGFDRAERKRRIDANLELVGLAGFGRKYPWQLSGGMQQRASIARALCFDPDLLLIPEAVFLSTRIVVMSPRPGRIHEIIDCDLGPDRPLDIRDTPEFLAIAHRVREGLRAGHGYD